MNFLKLALVILSAGGVAAAVTVPNYINSIRIEHQDEMIGIYKDQLQHTRDDNKYLTEGTVNINEM